MDCGIYDLPKYAPVSERFKYYKQAGFTHIALDWWDKHYRPYGETKEAALVTARSLGLIVDTIHIEFDHCSSIWLTGIKGTLKWLSYKRYLYRTIRECGKYGIKDAVFHYLKHPYPPLKEIGYKRYFKFLAFAKKHGVVICLENLRKNDCFDEILSRSKQEDRNVCIDTGHTTCFAHDEMGTIKKYCQFHVETVHLHDNDTFNDQHMLLGDGKMNIKADIDELLKHYNGVMYLEVSPKMYKPDSPDFDFKAFVNDAYKKLNGFLPQDGGKL